MYYNFSFENQSVEARTGISIADKFLNLFLGKISVQITDQYEKILSDFTVKSFESSAFLQSFAIGKLELGIKAGLLFIAVFPAIMIAIITAVKKSFKKI